jgi:hypothetical protein
VIHANLEIPDTTSSVKTSASSASSHNLQFAQLSVDREIVKKEESAQILAKREETSRKSSTEKFIQSTIDKDHFKNKTGGTSSSSDSTFALNFQSRDNLKRGGRHDQLVTKNTSLQDSDCIIESKYREQIKIDFSFAEERIEMQRKISDLEMAICRMSDQGMETTVMLEKQVQELKAENACLKRALEVTLSKVRQWNQEMLRAGMQNGL